MRMTVEAPAKLNLYLEVGGTRPDGYHDVRTVLVALDLHDTVVVEPAERLVLECTPAIGPSCEDNLAWRAAETFARATGRMARCSIRIEKRIPAAAGLGGGSADAAAVLAALARMWDVASDDPRLLATAKALGADVPFLLRGGCAVYAGRGDRFVRALPLPTAVFALVNPREPLSTAEAYASFDRLPRQPMAGLRHVSAAECLGDPVALGAAVDDNMVEASAGLVPAIRDEIASFKAAPGCLGVALAGSGATVFGVFADGEAAVAAAETAAGRGWWSATARPRPEGTLAQTGAAYR
jgi:4-diphosphocytidyl-2-C-methyl-D-erythritol kinase